MDITAITQMAGNACYAFLALDALWGAFCVIIVWRRVAQLRFRSEQSQDEFMDPVNSSVASGDLATARTYCEGEDRATPQLALLAIDNRDLGYSKVRHLVADRFQRDVLADLEYRLSWVATVIKSAPMLGLFGTVLGMMSAFAKLSTGSTKVDPTNLAEDISLALITTAIGLAIAIPLTLCTASINIRVRKLEDLVGLGLNRFFESFRLAVPEEGLRKG